MTQDKGASVIIIDEQHRAFEVKEQLAKLNDSLQDGFIDLCDLLREARDKNYHLYYQDDKGEYYTRFDAWVEEGSALDISARQAYYYIRVSEVAEDMGLDKAQLKKIGISKLREILTLDTGKHMDAVKGLLESAENTPLNTVKEKVKAVKKGGSADGAQAVAYVTIKLPIEVKEIFDQAVELARKLYGSVNNEETGEIEDISISKAMELILVSYINDPNNAATLEQKIKDAAPF